MCCPIGVRTVNVFYIMESFLRVLSSQIQPVLEMKIVVLTLEILTLSMLELRSRIFKFGSVPFSDEPVLRLRSLTKTSFHIESGIVFRCPGPVVIFR